MLWLARSADIERQLLAPLEAVLRDAQALLDVELDTDRLEDAAGATSSDSSGHPSPAPDRGQSATNGIARPLVSRFSGPVRYGTVDSARPEASALEPGAVQKRPFERAERGFSSPSADAAMPAEPARTRFEQALHTASSTPPSGSPRVGTANHGAQDNDPQPVSRTSGVPRFPRHPAMDDPDEMAPPVHSRRMSREATSTTSAVRPSSATAERASMRSANPSTSTRPYFTGPAPLAESLVSSGTDDAAAVPATEQTHRLDKHLEAPTAAMPSGDGRQPTGADEATPLAASLADISQHVSPAPDSHRTLAIPLRPRQAAPTERSPIPKAASHLLGAARRLASAVEPSLEQAYRLTQARLDTSAASASERIESPSLVRNTFNVTVTLRADDASTSLDPTDLADALTEVLMTAARRHGLEI